MSHETGLRRFVRALLGGGTAVRIGEDFVTGVEGHRVSEKSILGLIAVGALDGDHRSCRANSETRMWLRRAHLEGNPLATQHRMVARSPDGMEVNYGESPLSRLAFSANGAAAFLDRHHLEAGERVRRLIERAQLQPRLTRDYATVHVSGAGHRSVEVSEVAANARREVAIICRLLPRDCAGVVIDVCALLKGLQQVERERGWPRRSAKLVLRIGLEQLALHYGLGSVATGPAQGLPTWWRQEGARPSRFE